MFLLGVVLTMVFSAVHRDGSLAENLLGLLACEAVALLLMGIEFDLILRFGTERGRYFLLGVVWVPIISLTALKNHPAFNRLVQAVGGMDSWPVSRFYGVPRGLSRGLRSGLRPLLADRDQNLSEKRILSRQAAACRIILALSAYDKAKERENGDFLTVLPLAVGGGRRGADDGCHGAVQCAAAAAPPVWVFPAVWAGALSADGGGEPQRCTASAHRRAETRSCFLLCAARRAFRLAAAFPGAGMLSRSGGCSCCSRAARGGRRYHEGSSSRAAISSALARRLHDADRHSLPRHRARPEKISDHCSNIAIYTIQPSRAQRNSTRTPMRRRSSSPVLSLRAS